MIYSKIRAWLQYLKSTPLHPQWLIFRNQKTFLKQIGTLVSGTVLDIGSGRQQVRQFLNPDCRYFPLDFYDTAINWYDFFPEIFADAQSLPIRNEKIDTILILDVLEHLPRPRNCMAEMYRVLKPGGKVIVHVPFLYPIHDSPLDFQRWTQYGLQEMAGRQNFTINKQDHYGNPVETATILLNLALSKAILNWHEHRNPLMLLGLFLPIVVLGNHFLSILSYLLTQKDNFMPLSYQMILKKAFTPDRDGA